MKNIVIIGAGGFGREVLWLISRINEVKKEWNVLGFIDDNKVGNVTDDYDVIGNIDWLLNSNDEIYVAIAVGNAKIRKQIYEKIKLNNNLHFPNLVDPSSTINDDFMKGIGNIICAGLISTVDISINNFNIINLQCTLGHDDIISDFVTIYPGVNVSGCVTINDCCEIGTGAKIIQGLNIVGDTVIGAGAVVVKNIDESGIYVGIPAKKI